MVEQTKLKAFSGVFIVKKRVIVSVINDLFSDRRVDRTCKTLCDMGFNVTLVGRRYNNSPSLQERNYHTYRMHLVFKRGPFFYAEFNIRLFFFLLFHKSNLLTANDLDTLLPNFLVHKLKGIPLVYDTHEYFTGVPELMNRPRIQKIWKIIERHIFPKIKHVITVNGSVARLYKEEYGNEMIVVRNIPENTGSAAKSSKSDLGLPTDKKIILLQGAGINVDRGAEEAVEAMQYIDDAILLILGGGDILDSLKAKVKDLNLHSKVKFIPRQVPEQLVEYTSKADVGLTLDKNTNVNYRYSLPNKLFDYIHARVPVLASRLTEVKSIVDKYDIGCFIDHHAPEHIADKIRQMIIDEAARERWKLNLIKAAAELSWENEQKILKEVYRNYA